MPGAGAQAGQRMNSRERMLSAMSGGPVDRPAVAPLYLDLYLHAEVRRRVTEHYLPLMRGRSALPLDPAQHVEVWTRAIVEAFHGLDSTPDWLCWMPELPPAAWLGECVLEAQGEALWRVHRPSGARERLDPQADPNPFGADAWDRALPSTREEVDQLVPLAEVEEILADGRLAVLAGLVRQLGPTTFVAAGMGTPFPDCFALLGFQGLMLMPVENPELFLHLLGRMQAAALARAEAFRRLGVDGIFLEESFTSADLISADLYERFVLPSTSALVEHVRGSGLPVIFYMTGDALPRLANVIQLAPTAFAVEEPKKGYRLDLGEIASAIGKRFAVFGNLDATRIKDWDDLELEAELQVQYRAGQAARGFTFSTGSPLPLDTPRERVAAFVRRAQAIRSA
jgi:uroporphyrinogen-III decarboxylase